MIINTPMATILVVALLLCSIEGYSPARGHEDYPGSDSVREESRRRLTAGVHAGIGSYGPPRLTGTIGYSRNNLNVYGYGSVDMNRNYGFGVGFNYRFKRNIQPPEIFHLKVELSPCQFAIYDVNEDGFVTLKEFKLVYNDYISNKLFKDLDQDRDGVVAFEEFYADPQIIEGLGCNSKAPPVDGQIDDADDDNEINNVEDEEANQS